MATLQRAQRPAAIATVSPSGVLGGRPGAAATPIHRRPRPPPQAPPALATAAYASHARRMAPPTARRPRPAPRPPTWPGTESTTTPVGRLHGALAFLHRGLDLDCERRD